MSPAEPNALAEFVSRDHRLQLLYVDATDTGVGAWRLTLSFAGPPGERPSPHFPPSAFHIRPCEDGAFAGVHVTAARWAVPGSVLQADAVVAAASASAKAYRLWIDAPDAVDPAASSGRFQAPGGGAAPAKPGAPIDYLTKDYAGFRQLMIATISRLLPDWRDTSEPDLGVTLIESLAYGADFLSYRQDAVGTEAYLETARQRTSIRRHLRLLGYTLSEGCAARVFVRVAVGGVAPVTVRAGAKFIAAPDLPPVADETSPEIERLIRLGHPVYEQLHDQALYPLLNGLRLASGSSVLPAGTAHFAVVVPSGLRELLAALDVGRIFGVSGARFAGGATVTHPFRLQALQTPRENGDGGPRLAVLVAEPDDALPWDLYVDTASMVSGNLVLAEFGQTVTELLPPVSDGQSLRLPQPHVTPVSPYRPDDSALRLLQPDPTKATACVTLQEFLPYDCAAATASGSVAGDTAVAIPNGSTPPGMLALPGVWRCVSDLLESSATARRFVTEFDRHGQAVLRFGDGIFGRRPTPGARFLARYRVGKLRSAVVGQGVLDTLLPGPGDDAPLLHRIVAVVENATPSQGLLRPESTRSAIMRAQALARTVQTCVTLEDYAAAAEALPGVAEARAGLVREGAGRVILVRIRAKDQLAVGEPLISTVRRALDGRRLAGRRVAVAGPRFAPLSVALSVTADDASAEGSLRARIAEAFSARPLGFFAPARLAFGAPVFASRMLEQLLAVEGVVRGEVVRLGCKGRPPAGAFVTLRPDEIPVLDPADLRVEFAA